MTFELALKDTRRTYPLILWPLLIPETSELISLVQNVNGGWLVWAIAVLRANRIDSSPPPAGGAQALWNSLAVHLHQMLHYHRKPFLQLGAGSSRLIADRIYLWIRLPFACPGDWIVHETPRYVESQDASFMLKPQKKKNNDNTAFVSYPFPWVSPVICFGKWSFVVKLPIPPHTEIRNSSNSNVIQVTFTTVLCSVT